ncbi:MAG: hypothetical protein V4527_18180 [Pseudomonadota bacterium]
MNAPLVTNNVLTARVGINGQDFLFFCWPEAAWLVELDSMVREDEGVSAFKTPDRRK